MKVYEKDFKEESVKLYMLLSSSNSSIIWIFASLWNGIGIWQTNERPPGDEKQSFSNEAIFPNWWQRSPPQELVLL